MTNPGCIRGGRRSGGRAVAEPTVPGLRQNWSGTSVRSLADTLCQSPPGALGAKKSS